MDEIAVIRSFSYDDPETGDKIALSVWSYYSKITVNNREYYFVRETGEFDGTATVIQINGPVHIDDGE